MGKDSKKFKFFDAEARAERFRKAIKGGYLSRSNLALITRQFFEKRRIAKKHQLW